MKTIQTAFCISMLFVTSFASADVVVFDHDFENSTPGNLSDTGALGTPAVGTLSATGGFVSTDRPAYTTGANGTSNSIPAAFNLVDRTDGAGNVVLDGAGEVIQDAVFVDQTINDVGTPAGNFLTANLSSPAAISGVLGAGQTTTIDFQIASFGTNNETDFKYAHVIGLSSSGDEVFQILWRAGSGGARREAFAREFGEDNTTFAGGAFASVDGTKILDDVAFNINSINTAASPSARIGVSITFDDLGWNASAAPTGGGFSSTPASGLGIASGATDLASIVFFSSHNSVVDTQNKGLWIDNIVVQTDLLAVPEPSSMAFLCAAGLGSFVRRRR